jgi:regulator of nucleoside diphosphate kinase
MNVNVPLPSIIIGTHDYCDLVRAAGVSGPGREREFLRTELQRAVIAHPHDVPADAITIDSRVTYRLNGDPETLTRVLVQSGYVRWPSAELSVMTPLGTALLGLRVGDSMPFRTSDGLQHEVLVEDVGFRPLTGVVPYESVTHCQSPPILENSKESLDRRLDAALEEASRPATRFRSLCRAELAKRLELTGGSWSSGD